LIFVELLKNLTRNRWLGKSPAEKGGHIIGERHYFSRDSLAGFGWGTHRVTRHCKMKLRCPMREILVLKGREVFLGD
jgi:hypothetical protein